MVKIAFNMLSLLHIIVKILKNILKEYRKFSHLSISIIGKRQIFPQNKKTKKV